MVQPRETTNHDWSDAPTVPIKPDRYGGDAPTWPIASPPPSRGRQERPRQPFDTGHQTQTHYVPEPPRRQPWFIQRAPGIICLVFTVIEILIGIRVLLKLFGANPAAEFTGLIYAFTDPFVAPFQGVFPTPSGYGSVLEISSALAIPIYALLARLCISIARLIRDRRPTSRAHS